MAAYASLVSLMHIIDQIKHHPFPPISLDKEQVESLTQIVAFLQEFLESYISPFSYGNEADPLEMRIADAAYAAEDVIESHIVDRILPGVSEDQRNGIGFCNCFRSLKEPKNEGEKINSLDLHQDLQKVIEDMDLIKKEAKEIVADNGVVPNQLQSKFSATGGSLVSSSTGKKSTMVGFDDVLLEIMDKLTGGRLDRQVIPIIGMGGIGKTTLARNIYAQPLINEHFDICAWATISQQYNTKEILWKLLSQANKEGNQRLGKMREDELGLALYKYLSHRRFFIVLDDMWSIEAWDKMKHFFPNNDNGSRIVVTTRLSNLGSQLDNNHCIEMKFLDEVSSWNLFSKIVFGEKSFPVELEKIGKKIVKNCRGLPLSIVVMGGLLEKLVHTKEGWEYIRRDLNSIVNSENDEHCLKILKMSYDHLPVYLKPCFLYMGVFEEDKTIRVSKVIKLWVCEGFLKPITGKCLETTAKECLKELIDRNLILVDGLGSTGSLKNCKTHDLLRDLCLREAQKQRFYHVVGQHGARGTYSQRRVAIPWSNSKKEVREALESIPHARSCISNNETVRRLPKSRFLRILEAYEKGLYQWHCYVLRNVFELVNSRYLNVGVHRRSKLPSSINLLWNLQTLVVAHPRRVKAPVEIWKMPQLRHVHFCKKGLHLPDPPSDSVVVMENLQTLKGIRNFKCDQEVVERIPNIKKLGLKYNKDKGIGLREDYYGFGNFERLHKLESLSCKGNRFGSYMHMVTFPRSLRKLSLSAGGFVWQDVLEKLGSLPLLEKLKLQSGQFRRGEWETVDGGFRKLKFLSLSFCWHLEYWRMESSSHFPCLEHLHLSGLSELKEIPTEIGDIPTLQLIRLIYCGESVVMSAKKMVEEQEELKGEDLSFKVVVLLSKKNQALQSLASHNFLVPNLRSPLSTLVSQLLYNYQLF